MQRLTVPVCGRAKVVLSQSAGIVPTTWPSSHISVTVAGKSEGFDHSSRAVHSHGGVVSMTQVRFVGGAGVSVHSKKRVPSSVVGITEEPLTTTIVSTVGLPIQLQNSNCELVPCVPVLPNW